MAAGALLGAAHEARANVCSCPGDLTINALQDGLDLQPFVECLLGGPSVAPGCECADVNCDTAVDELDVLGFVTALLGKQSCYTLERELEPGTWHMPPASPCDEKNCSRRGDEDAGLGIYLFSGESYHAAEDLRIRGRGFDFVWARKYRSRFGPNSAQGNSWDFSYNIYLETSGADLVLHDGNSRTDTYVLQPNSKWAREEFFREIEQNLDDSFTLVFADTGRWNFHEFSHPTAPGRLSSIVDRNGNAMSFDYDAQGRLVTIHDTLDTPSHDRDMTISYNGDGFIASVTDYIGRSVSYQYYDGIEPGGNFGDLKSATGPPVVGTPNGNDFPGGKTTTYTYSTGFSDPRLNHNLLSMTDPKGQTYLQYEYAAVTNPNDIRFDRAIRQVWGDPGDIIDWTVTGFASSGLYRIIVTVNDRVGNVSEYSYDALNRMVRAREFTGRAPDPDGPTSGSQNLPVGKIRPDDPDVFETNYEFNADSLLTRAVFPNLNEVQNVYEVELDPAAAPRMRGNLREVHRLPGPLGGDQAMISEFYEYDSDFGGCGCGTNFVTRHLDGRGNESLHTYDAAGNRLHTSHRIPTIVEDFEYNAFGQMTMRTLPENGGGSRREDTFSYFLVGPQMGYLQSEVIDSGGLNLTTSYECDAVGNVVRQVHPDGGDSLWAYNSLDQAVVKLSRETLTGGGNRYETLIWRDANDNVMRTDTENVDENGTVLANSHWTSIYSHEQLDQVTQICQERIDVLLTDVDLTCASFPVGTAVTTEYGYDANRNRTMVLSGMAVSGADPDNRVQVLYDERDLRFQEIRAPGTGIQSSTQYDYDVNANEKSSTQGLEGAEPRITVFTYDGYDRLTATTDPMGNVATYNYDANGNREGTEFNGEFLDLPGDAGNIRLSETADQYDAMDRRIRRDVAFFDTETQAAIGDGQSTTQWFYADDSQLTQVFFDLPGHQVNFTYDTANRKSVARDAKNNTVTYSYDANSNVVQVEELDKSDLGAAFDESFTTEYEYDDLDRLIRTTDNLLNTQLHAYDSRDNRMLHTDARGNQTRNHYDGLNRLVRTVHDMDADGPDDALPGDGDPDIVITRQWDDSSHLTARTDDNGNATSFQYDSLDRHEATIFADCSTDSTAYDVHDNAVSVIDANLTQVDCQYDLLNRLTAKSVVSFGAGVAGPPLATSFENYEYDGLSRLIRAEDDDSLVIRGSAFTSGYNSLSRIIRETQEHTNPPSAPQLIAAVYDGEGNQTRLTYPGGRVIVRTYDALDRPFVVRDDPPGPGATLAVHRYLGPYRLQQRDEPNGAAAELVRMTRLYDGDRRVSEIQHVRDPAGAAVMLDHRVYSWDPNDNRLSAELLTAPAPPVIKLYTYDAMNRLIQTDHQTPALPPPVEYTLDGVGNRAQVNGPVNPGPYTMDPTLCDPGDFQMNQYTTTPFNPQRLNDDNGNLSSLPGFTTFNYDYRNQLVRFDNLLAGQMTTYRYDCLGRRISKAIAAVPVIDGTVEALYGPALSTQDVQTQFGDSSSGQIDFANGSELDAAFARVEGGVLYLMLAGNLESNFNKLEIFIDSTPGAGQNHLRGDNSDVDFGGLNRMGDDGGGNGLTFDAGFEADFWLGMNGGDGGGGTYALFANYAELLNAGGGLGYYLGAGTAVSDGTLDASGTNPFGIRLTIHNGNTAGVTGGTGPDSGAGVNTGVEWAIPLAAIGTPTGEIKLCVFVNAVGHDFLSNQVLGGIGGGDNLGEPRAVNFNAIGSLQSFNVTIPSGGGTAAPTRFVYHGSAEIAELDSTGATTATYVWSEGDRGVQNPWGDYGAMRVDPAQDLSFWTSPPVLYTIEYHASRALKGMAARGESRKNRIFDPVRGGKTDFCHGLMGALHDGLIGGPHSSDLEYGHAVFGGFSWAGALQMEQSGQKCFFLTDDQNSVAKLTDQTGNVLAGWEYEDYGKPIAQPSASYTQPPDQQQAYRSDLSDQEPGPQAIADDFTLAAPETITGLRWWGAYDPGIQAHANDFHITIFDDNSGAPGNPIFQESAGNNVAAVSTGQFVGGEDERIYEYTLTNEFPAQAGVTYWLSIENTLAQPGITPWKWESGGPGNNQSFWSSDQFGPWNQQPADLAFELHADPPDTGNPFLFHGHYFDAESGLYWCDDRYLATASGRYISRVGPISATAAANAAAMGNAFSYALNNPSSRIGYPVFATVDSPGSQPPWMTTEGMIGWRPTTRQQGKKLECNVNCDGDSGDYALDFPGACAGGEEKSICLGAKVRAWHAADKDCPRIKNCECILDNDKTAGMGDGSCKTVAIGLGKQVCRCSCRVTVAGTCAIK
jgi:RHS repeat-associated protein